jgi:uncharacterized protein
MKNDDIKILVKHRLDQANICIQDAKYLLDGNRSSQSVVNRCYYAMYYAVVALLQKIGKIPSKHSGVISLFDTEFVLKEIFPKELSKDFHKAFELRQISDYQINNEITKEKSNELMNKAIKFVKAIEEYINSEC